MSRLRNERNQQNKDKKQPKKKLDPPKKVDHFCVWKVEDEYDEFGIENWMQKRKEGSGKHGKYKRTVISEELEPYLTKVGFICSEIFDVQKFFFESRPRYKEIKCSEKKDKTENEDNKLQTNQTSSVETNKAKPLLHKTNSVKSEFRISEQKNGKSSILQNPENLINLSQNKRSQNISTRNNSGTIASHAKRRSRSMLDLNQSTPQKGPTCDINWNGNVQTQEKTDETSPKNYEPETISFRKTPPLTFKYSKGSVSQTSSSTSLGSTTQGNGHQLENSERLNFSTKQSQDLFIRRNKTDAGGSISLVHGLNKNNNQLDLHGGLRSIEKLHTTLGCNGLVSHLHNNNGRKQRPASLSANSTQKQVQLVLKRVCLLDENLQEKKTLSPVERLIQNRAKTASSITRTASVTPRPSTSTVTTLSLDANMLPDSADRSSSRGGSSGLEGYMNSYYRDRLNSHMFQIGDLLPAVDDHNNRNIDKQRRKNSKGANEGVNSNMSENIPSKSDNLLQREDGMFTVNEGGASRQYIGPPSFRPFSHRTKENTHSRLGQQCMQITQDRDRGFGSRWQSSSGSLYSKQNGNEEVVGKLPRRRTVLQKQITEKYRGASSPHHQLISN